MADETSNSKKEIISKPLAEALVSSGKMNQDLLPRLFSTAPVQAEELNYSPAPTPSELESMEIVAEEEASVPDSGAAVMESIDTLRSAEDEAKMKFEDAANKAREKQDRSSSYYGVPKYMTEGRTAPTSEDVLREAESETRRVAMEEQQAEADLAQRIEERKNQILRAQKIGMKLPKEEIDDLIAEREASLEEKMEIASEPTQAEVDLEAAPIRKQVAAQRATQQSEEELARKAQMEAIAGAQRAQAIEDSVKPLVENSKWFQPGSLSFILAAALSGGAAVAAGIKGNPFLDGYRQKIKDELDAKNATAEQKVAAEKMALEQARYQLDVRKQKTSDREALSRINKMDTEIALELEALNRQLAMGTKTTGLTTNELFATVPKIADREPWVNVNGKWYQAGNKSSAATVRKAMESGEPARRSLNKLREISKKTGSGLFSPTAWREADQEVKTLIGALRVPLFGPGVMTEQERADAAKIIPDPTSIKGALLPERTQKLLSNLSQKFVQAERDALRRAGINLPPSPNEVKLQQFLNANQNNKLFQGEQGRAKAINALISEGVWNANEDL